jgi:arginyl-tRNA synthetase
VIEDEKFYSLQKDVVFENDEEVYLVRLLWEYKQSLEDMVEKNMPHILCAYIYTLTKSFSAFYNKVHILNETDGEKKYIRLQLVALFWWVIKDALTILWIEVPEKM